MSQIARVQLEKPLAPPAAFLYDGRWFRPAEARKWSESADEPWRELYRLPGPDPVWVMVNLPLFWHELPCATQVGEAAAAQFLLQNGHDVPDELTDAAENLRLTASNNKAALSGLNAHALEPRRSQEDARHSDDFRSVSWFGTRYAFTKTQAACVKVLWEAWERGVPELDQQTVLEAADAASARLVDVFKRSPAWNVMIVRGSTQGAFRLAADRP